MGELQPWRPMLTPWKSAGVGVFDADNVQIAAVFDERDGDFIASTVNRIEALDREVTRQFEALSHEIDSSIAIRAERDEWKRKAENLVQATGKLAMENAELRALVEKLRRAGEAQGQAHRGRR